MTVSKPRASNHLSGADTNSITSIRSHRRNVSDTSYHHHRRRRRIQEESSASFSDAMSVPESVASESAAFDDANSTAIANSTAADAGASSLAGTGATQDLTVASAIGSGLGSAAATVGDAASSLGDTAVGSAVGSAVGAAGEALSNTSLQDVGDVVGGAAGAVGGAVGSAVGSVGGLIGGGGDGGGTTDDGGEAMDAQMETETDPPAYFTEAVSDAEESGGGGGGGGSLTKEQYQSLHRHVQLCPGFEVFKVQGYADLEGLRADLQNYFEFVRAGRLSTASSSSTASSTSTASSSSTAVAQGVATTVSPAAETNANITATATSATSATFAPLTSLSPVSEIIGTNATDDDVLDDNDDNNDNTNTTVSDTNSTSYPVTENPFPSTNGTDIDIDVDIDTDAMENTTAAVAMENTTATGMSNATDTDVDNYGNATDFDAADVNVNATATDVNSTDVALSDPIPSTCRTDVFQCGDFSLVERDPSDDCRYAPCADGTAIPEEVQANGRLDDAGAGYGIDDDGYGDNATDTTAVNATDSAGFEGTASVVLPTTSTVGDGDDFNATNSTNVEEDDFNNTTSASATAYASTIGDAITTSASTMPAARKRIRSHGDEGTFERPSLRGLRRLQQGDGNGDDEAEAGQGGVATDEVIPAGTPIVFDVCPNTQFDFENLPPLAIETPVEHPLWINCRKDFLGSADPEDTRDACVFLGGKTHWVFYHRPSPDGQPAAAVVAAASGNYLATVRGFTFREATETSILLKDPRGNVAIEESVFEANAGVATVHVDGTYDGDVSSEWWFPVAVAGSDATVAAAAVTTTTVSAGGTPSSLTTTTATAMSATAAPMGNPTRNETSTPIVNVTDDLLGNETYYGANATADPFSSTSSTAWSDVTASPLPGRDLAEVASVPASVVSIRQCSFAGNSGDATILINSFVDEITSEEQDPGTLDPTDDLFSAEPSVRADVPHKHSIHLTLEDSTFTGETVSRAVIMNDGARLQSSFCRFVDNTAADSVIKLQSGTLAVYGNEFTNNEVGQEGGPIQVDVASTLEASTGNCEKSALTSQTDGGSTETSTETMVSAKQGLISTITGSDGDAAASNGDTAAAKQQDVASNATAPGNTTTAAGEAPAKEDAPQAKPVCGISVLGVCVEEFGQECRAATDPPTGCITTWDALVNAVKDRSQTDPDFKICPGYTLDVGTEGPVVIDADYTSIQCGDEGLLGDECTIRGGFTQFQVVGSPEGVELSGLTMQGSTGASVVAGGSKESTLRLRDCAWTQNTGASAVLIRDDVQTEFNEDTSVLLASNATAMSVEIRDCEFKKNKVSHGTVSNMGGTLVIYKNRFENNTALGGDIVIANSGTCKLQENCFLSHSSIAAGTIFVQEGAALSGNANNFGALNAAGKFSKGRCNDIFHETNGTDCLAEGEPCNGFCMTFDADKCSLDSAETPNIPLDNAGITIQTKLEDGGKQNLTPIIVATVVAAFTVFGMAVIIIRRKQKGKNRGSDTDISNSRSKGGSKGGGMFSKFKKKKAHDTSAYDVEDDEDL